MARQVEKEVAKVRVDFASSLHGQESELTHYRRLPDAGMPRETMLAYLDGLRKIGKVDWRAGKISGTVYVGEEELEEYTDLLTEVYGMFAWTNPLHPGVFPGVRKMESEIVAMTVDMFNGGDEACGVVTSGGTESISLAIKAYRDLAATERGVTNPNIVVPISVHSAFEKACLLFKINVRYARVDDWTRQVDVSHVASLIDSNTIMIAGSCPQFPHGIVDPITELATLASTWGIGMHVDCCLGSFLVCNMRRAGYDFPDFDLSVPGVTSISVDTHKYGFAPKGSSVLLYSSHRTRMYQYSLLPDWQGGVYATANLPGSRPGALVAATWAALMLQGRDGYVSKTKRIVDTARYIADGIRDIDGVRLMGDPLVSVVAFTSDDFNINRLMEPLVEEKGWDLNVLQFPASMHICVTLMHTSPNVADNFLRDLREAATQILNDPSTDLTGAAAMYGMAQSIPDRSIIGLIASTYLDLTNELPTDTPDGGDFAKDLEVVERAANVRMKAQGRPQTTPTKSKKAPAAVAAASSPEPKAKAKGKAKAGSTKAKGKGKAKAASTKAKAAADAPSTRRTTRSRK